MQVWKEALTRIKPIDTLILDFQSLELSENRRLLFKPLSQWYLVMATQTDYYKSVLQTAIRIKFKNLKHKDNISGHHTSVSYCYSVKYKLITISYQAIYGRSSTSA